MRNSFRVLVVLVFTLLVAAGCNSTNDGKVNTEDQKESTENEETSEQKDEMSGDLSNGIEEVMASLQDLQTAVKAEPSDPEQIKTAGEKLEENWDAIEKKVEEEYPEDYTNIEESLYPLMDEAKQNQQNLEKIQQLMNDTMEKMKAFKEKVASSS
ncbi:hypothetical protein [Pseudalkalibacillus decolorationis]|uniref:hypothetical protein n=1 Tax=Pseudalkalibacillus decolorationis TaxID=163879 RepID=UPI002147B8AE|nr:hypothetical protein [Pseudalkalibacillus decolorationis]